ncbi:tRNA (adenosine(37)-N6)-threonylcarbamoyltransferase complex ATPase subunit type 1 TsaE [candidate division KSB1 bacterium]|nr:tRNA (adenosine(37)-N6)-threonylcarbamoyltransferase complex ATPase subunit type 1 TsaE [candidate division KSB1 bacterium]
MDNWITVTHSEKETLGVGRMLASRLAKGDVVALMGELGAGKTVMVKGICAGLGVKKGVRSPSFVLMARYEGRVPIYHIDLYRLNSTQDILGLGFHEFINGSGISLIEWAEKAKGLLPPNRWEVELKYVPGEEKARDIHIQHIVKLRLPGPCGHTIHGRLRSSSERLAPDR